MTETNKTMRAALYARVSTNTQDIEPQLLTLRRYAELREWGVVGEYIDNGVSGAAQAYREEQERLLIDVEQGKVDVVVVTRFDRWARSTVHLLQSLEMFRKKGVSFVAIHQDFDTTTSVGKLVISILGSVAEFERELMTERTIAGVRAAQEKGVHCGRPYIAVDTKAAEVLLRKGMSLKAAAKQLEVARPTLRRRLTEAGLWTKYGFRDNQDPNAVAVELGILRARIAELEAQTNREIL